MWNNTAGRAKTLQDLWRECHPFHPREAWLLTSVPHTAVGVDDGGWRFCCALVLWRYETIYIIQGLRSLSKPLQSGKLNRTTMATELARESLDREAAVLPLPLQEAKGAPTAGEVMALRALKARLTAHQPQVILTGSNDRCKLGAPRRASTHFCGR